MLYPYSYQLDTQPYEIIISKAIYVDKQSNQSDNNTDNTDDNDDDPVPFPPSSSSSGLGVGWIILIVIGGILLVVGITYAIFKK